MNSLSKVALFTESASDSQRPSLRKRRQGLPTPVVTIKSMRSDPRLVASAFADRICCMQCLKASFPQNREGEPYETRSHSCRNLPSCRSGSVVHVALVCHIRAMDCRHSSSDSLNTGCLYR